MSDDPEQPPELRISLEQFKESSAQLGPIKLVKPLSERLRQLAAQLEDDTVSDARPDVAEELRELAGLLEGCYVRLE